MEYWSGSQPMDIYAVTSTTSMSSRMGYYLDETHKRVGQALDRQGMAARQETWSAIENTPILTKKNLMAMFDASN
jgi:hypothetical protein